MSMISKYFSFLSKLTKDKKTVEPKVETPSNKRVGDFKEFKTPVQAQPSLYKAPEWRSKYYHPETDGQVNTTDVSEPKIDETTLPFPTDVDFGDYVKISNWDGLTDNQKKFLEGKKEFFVKDVIVKDGLTYFEVGYNIPFKAYRFEKVEIKYDHRVLFLQFSLAIDTHGEPDTKNFFKGCKNSSELFPILINEKLPNSLVDFYNYTDIYRIGNSYFINNFDIKDYDFVFFGFAKKHSNIPYYIQKYLKNKNVPFITYESYNLYDDKIYGLDIVNELGYDYLPTIQTIKLNKKIIEHVINDFGFPVIVKITSMDQGKGVFKINTLEELKQFYLNNNHTTFIQKLIPNDGDTRIILLKNKVQLVVKRQTAEGSTEFRSNVALGGKAIPTTIPQEIIDMCEDISKHVECDIIGFDILKDLNDGKYYVMEINVSPHFSTFSVVTGINVPGLFVDYIVSKVTGVEPKPIEVVENVPVPVQEKTEDVVKEELDNTSKSYLDGSGEDGFSLSEVKSLEIGENITFYFNDSLLDGKIIDKEVIGYDTIFTIETEKGQLKKSYKLLNVYKTY